MFRFDFLSFLIGCCIGSAGLTFIVNILSHFFNN